MFWIKLIAGLLILTICIAKIVDDLSQKKPIRGNRRVGALPLTLVALAAMSTPARAEANDVCRAREQRCEMRCSAQNRVGSMEHLKCNDQCRYIESFCRKERD